jgi:DNA-binding transcriptional MocR family regulator
MSRRNRTGRSNGTGRYVAISHWMMRTEAWRSLNTVARCAYVELAARYAGPGSNNGRLPYSLREMAEALNVSKMTAQRALVMLQERGFIVETKRGAFSLKERHATEYRLTEFGCDVTGALSTKDFARWRKQNTISPENPYGFRRDTVRVS